MKMLIGTTVNSTEKTITHEYLDTHTQDTTIETSSLSEAKQREMLSDFVVLSGLTQDSLEITIKTELYGIQYIYDSIEISQEHFPNWAVEIKEKLLKIRSKMLTERDNTTDGDYRTTLQGILRKWPI